MRKRMTGVMALALVNFFALQALIGNGIDLLEEHADWSVKMSSRAGQADSSRGWCVCRANAEFAPFAGGGNRVTDCIGVGAH